MDKTVILSTIVRHLFEVAFAVNFLIIITTTASTSICSSVALHHVTLCINLIPV